MTGPWYDRNSRLFTKFTTPQDSPFPSGLKLNCKTGEHCIYVSHGEEIPDECPICAGKKWPPECECAQPVIGDRDPLTRTWHCLGCNLPLREDRLEGLMPPHDIEEGEFPCLCFVDENGIIDGVIDEYTPDICRQTIGIELPMRYARRKKCAESR